MKMKNNYIVFSFIFWLVCGKMAMMANNETLGVDVGVILDFDDWIGMVGLSCINMSLSQFYAAHSHYKTRLLLHTRDSNKDVVSAAAAALDLIKNVEVKAIIGPARSIQANFVIDLGEKAQVPIISFSATSPSQASIRSPYFFQATRSDSCQVKVISAIIQVIGWKEAVPVYVDDEFGVGIIPYLTDALQAVDARVPYWSAISLGATDDQILEELFTLKSMQTRVFILHMHPTLGIRLFRIAKEIGMMSSGYVWIMTDSMTDFLDSMDYPDIESMEGVLGVEPSVPRTKKIENFQAQWKKKFHHDHPDIIDAELNIYGLWAYDAVVALAMAIEKVAARTKNLGFLKENVSGAISTDLESLRASKIGADLQQSLSNTNFKGITGNFSFINGQLLSSVFQIVNVKGGKATTVGFWLPENGLVKRLMSPTAQGYNPPADTSISTVIWPGDTASVPKGWEIPTNGKKLRIGVPVKEGFTQFLNVTRDPVTKVSKIEGYCIDLFDAVVAELPYAMTYEYIPFANPDGKSDGSYNSLIEQVYHGEYDAAVGDISIVANRSIYVDFTLPYMESGRVTMIVPITDDRSTKSWVFLKPLTWDLWLAILCFLLFIGFVVWVLEHRINDDFRGNPSQQVGTSFLFSFSTMVFAQRERVVSNLARIVVIIWCFVGLILTQSYTASLSSFLTVQQLQPSVTTIDELIKSRERVGHQQGSFVQAILTSLGFDESNLVSYKSAEECNELLSKGSRNGGVAAAFDVPITIHLILAQNCTKYTLVEPTSMLKNSRWKNISNIEEFNTDGFGFAFPKGSPLAPDISRAILKVTEGGKIKEIKRKWFGPQTLCPDRINSVPFNTLGLNSFWGLFLIAGIVSVLALIIYISMFIQQNREVLMPSSSDSTVSTWRRRILDLLRIFNEKDFRSHFLKKDVVNNDRNGLSFPLSPDSIHTNITAEQMSEMSPSFDADHNLTNGIAIPYDDQRIIELPNTYNQEAHLPTETILEID